MIDFTKMGFEDGRRIELNRSGPLKDFHITGAESFNALAYYYYYYIEVTRRRGRRRKKLLDDLKDRRGYCQLKEETLDRTMWRNRFERGLGPVV